MNLSLLNLELAVVGLGLVFLVVDLWAPAGFRRGLGYLGALALLGVLAMSFKIPGDVSGLGFGDMFVVDGLALFFKRLFLIAGAMVLVMAAESLGEPSPLAAAASAGPGLEKEERPICPGAAAPARGSGVTEYYSLVLFALAGMMCAASANHFAVFFVSIELMTVSFYVLTSFQRRRVASLEAGVKYLVLGGLSTAFLTYGIALIFGSSGTMAFDELAKTAAGLGERPIFLLGVLLVLAALGFKIAAVPFQLWAPDVYQGAPTPTTAFLAVGSKAAGFALLLRLLQAVLPGTAARWETLLVLLAAMTILYGNLCALKQTDIKRLLGYSSIANAGYLLMGVVAMNRAGSAAVLYYLAGYLFTLMAAFTVISILSGQGETADLSALAGLGRRSPFLAATLTMSMVSLAGIPPLAGFFGKFLLVKSALEGGATNHLLFGLAGVAIIGVVISLAYYLGVVRIIYWSEGATDLSPVRTSWAHRLVLGVCIVGMLYLGILPGGLVALAEQAVRVLRLG